MKIIQTVSLVLLVVLCVMFTGCASIQEGRKRGVTVMANVPGASATLETRSQKNTQKLPYTFILDTRHDRGKITLTTFDMQGRIIIVPIHWESKHNGTMLGGAGIMTIVFGVAGPISLGTDLYTKANKDLSEDTIMVDFLSLYAAEAQAQGLQKPTANIVPDTTPKRPCPDLGKTSSGAVYRDGQGRIVLNPQNPPKQ